MSDNTKQIAELSRNFAEQRALEWFDKTTDTLESVLRGIKQRREQFVAIRADKQRVLYNTVNTRDLLSWAANELRAIDMNVRTDLLVSIGADLAVADHLMKSAKT